jgi:hypothetical protein
MDVYKTAQELLEKFGGIALEKQHNFGEIITENNWNIDMETGMISFGDNLVFPFQILGTFSHSSESWLWAWANEKSGIPEKLMEQALILKKYGEDNGIDLLKNSEFEADKNDLHLIGIIASGMFNSSCYYLGNYGSGTMCVTIKSKEIDKYFENNHLKIFTVFPQLISLFEMNHRNSFINYLKEKDYKIEIKEKEIVGIRNGNKAIATFDELNRLTKLNG